MLERRQENLPLRRLMERDVDEDDDADEVSEIMEVLEVVKVFFEAFSGVFEELDLVDDVP